MSQDELDSSKLGTLEYWEEAYSKEIENFKDNGDEGEVWFGIQSVRRVINWIKNSKFGKESQIIDIGCGNGYTCCKLAEDGFENVLGVDYSERAIELAKSIAEDQKLQIEYQVMDVLDKEQFPESKFDMAIDKGTYDAIALCPVDPKTKRFLYREFLRAILKDKSTFIITSCNWTKDELISFFTQEKEFEFFEEINAASNFSFGGNSGSTTSTCVFKFTRLVQ